MARKRLLTHDVDGMDRVRFESFWQTWLFFGRIKCVLGTDIPFRTLYLCNEDPKKVLCYHEASASCRCLDHRLRSLRPSHLIGTQQEVTKDLNYAGNMWIHLHDDYDTQRINGMILFSLRVLHEFLVLTRNLVFLHNPIPVSTTYPDHNSLYFPLSRMRDDSWCSQQIHLPEAFPPSFRYFASQIDRPDPGRDHSIYTELRCFAHEADLSSIGPKHMIPECDCQHLKADQRLMHSLLCNVHTLL